MKNTLLFFVLSLFFVSGFAQSDSTKVPPYQRYPTLPPIKILLSDSSTMYTKDQIPTGKPVLFMIFSPDCSHCQHETEELIAHIDELKDVQIVMITYHPLSAMKDFINNYGLAKYSNIVVGKDIYYITMGFYDIHNIPSMAMYNKKEKLIEKLEGSVPISKVIEILKEK
jgi:thiol-disulfide isomerase/thioredoxin